MAKYRPVDLRLWSDKRFLSLSDRGRLLWVFYLTTPSSLPIPGVIVGGEATLAEQLGWSVEEYRMGYRELVEKGMKVRAEGRVVWLSNALKYQRIAGPKAIKGMSKVWDDIPEGELKAKIYEALKIACKSWSGLFAKVYGKGYGEGYAQLLMEGLDTGSGTGSGTRSGSGSGTGSLSRAREPDPPTGSESSPAKEPDPSGKLIALPLEEPDRRKAAIVSKIGPAHAAAFQRVKSEIGSTAMGPSMADHFTELRELVDTLMGFDDVEERLEYALAIREAEARRKRTLQYFGSAMWKRQNFEKALTLTIADVEHAASGSQVDAMAVVDSFFDELARKEAT